MPGRQRNATEMFFATKVPVDNRNWAGTPCFVGEVVRIGFTSTQLRPDQWVELVVYALGHGPGGPVWVWDQGPSPVSQAPDPSTTDIYSEVERVDQSDSAFHRGVPTWDGNQLEIGGQTYPAGKWSKVTVRSTGWAARREAEYNSGDAVSE